MIDPQRVLGGLLGIAVGGARGVAIGAVPSERIPVPKIGDAESSPTISRPLPCWTAHTGMAYCTVDALLGDYTLDRLGNHLAQWLAGEHGTSPPSADYVPTPIVEAMQRIGRGVPVVDAALTVDGEAPTDNSSLVRVLPVAIAFSRRSIPIMLDAVHSAMSITHAHPRCLMAAGLLSLIVRNLAYRRAYRAAYRYAMEDARKIYVAEPWRKQRSLFRRLMRGTLSEVARSAIRIDGEVNTTLEAAVWSLQTTRTFDDCLSLAIDLGDEQIPVGALAGGLAGLAHGVQAIPVSWIEALATRVKLTESAQRFAAVVTV